MQGEHKSKPVTTDRQESFCMHMPVSQHLAMDGFQLCYAFYRSERYNTAVPEFVKLLWYNNYVVIT
jgi:hypothetical protein